MESQALQNSEDHLALSRSYLARNFRQDARPWVIAYSGGKDSTLTLQLAYELLLSLPPGERKPVHVLASDTLVEAPNIEAYIRGSLALIAADARER